LGALDDKIEANRRMNATLEGIARALFKSWFVDFDPVSAKAEGRPPSSEYGGLPADLDALFPASFTDSPLGEIPAGWRWSDLSSLAILNPEAWNSRTKPQEIYYVDLSNTKWGKIEAVEIFQKDQAPSRAQRVLRLGDTIIGTVRPGNGSYAFIGQDGLTGSTGFAVIRPNRKEYFEFVYLAATEQENINRLSGLADGGAYPAVRPEAIIQTQICLPNIELIQAFSETLRPVFENIEQRKINSQTLATLRDTLLPKLISGQIRVKDAEKRVEAAV
jgi:type I restriction enzyme S subunit